MLLIYLIYFNNRNMSKQNQYIALLEKLLTHLKNAKLEYYKASDQAGSPEKKRFFNQQGLLRNRYFQETLIELQYFGMSSEDLVISRFNFDQLLISSIEILKATAIEKCIFADQTLLEIYTQLDSFEIKNLDLQKHVSNLEMAMSQNKEWVELILEKKRASY